VAREVPRNLQFIAAPNATLTPNPLPPAGEGANWIALADEDNFFCGASYTSRASMDVQLMHR